MLFFIFAGSLVAAFSERSTAVLAQELEIESDTNDDLTLEELLARVTQRTRLTQEDNLSYYGLLHLAASQPPGELESQAKKFTAERKAQTKLPTFVDMFKNPGDFVGKPVVLTGHVLQTVEADANENSHGITHQFESILFTEDSQAHPTTIVFLDKPDNLPLGSDLIDGVTVHGYYLKSYVYDSQDKHPRFAPLILAKTVSVKPQVSKQQNEGSQVVIYSLIAGGFAIFVTVLYLVQRSDRKRLLAAQRKRLDDQAPEFSH